MYDDESHHCVDQRMFMSSGQTKHGFRGSAFVRNFLFFFILKSKYEYDENNISSHWQLFHHNANGGFRRSLKREVIKEKSTCINLQTISRLASRSSTALPDPLLILVRKFNEYLTVTATIRYISGSQPRVCVLCLKRYIKDLGIDNGVDAWYLRKNMQYEY